MIEPFMKKPRRSAEEAAMDTALKKEREGFDLESFLPSYERATGLALVLDEAAENPDFIMRRSDGLVVGIELTSIQEQGPPDTPLFREIATGSRDLDIYDALDNLWRMIEQKSMKIPNYRTQYNLLVLQNVETNFARLCDEAQQIPVSDFASAGFQEIWLADFFYVRCGMHQEVELLGLYPIEMRYRIERSEHDRKPYR